MNEKMDSRFSQMHSKFIFLNERDNKINNEIKKEIMWKEQALRYPGNIIEKYSQASMKQNKIHISLVADLQNKMSMNPSNGISRDDPNSSSRTNSHSNSSPPTYKIFKNNTEIVVEGEIKEEFENEESVEDEPNENFKTNIKFINSAKKEEIRKPNLMKNMSGFSEGLQNMSVNKINKRFTKMEGEFNNIDVNQSYLDNGFKNMNTNFVIMDGSVKRSCYSNQESQPIHF